MILDFLAKLLNFDGIVDKIQEILEKVRAPINQGIDKVLEIIIGLAQKVFKNKGKEDKQPETNPKGNLVVKHPFKMEDEDHTLTAYFKDGKFRMTIASNPEDFQPALDDAITEVGKSSRRDKGKILGQLKAARKEYKEIAYELEDPKKIKAIYGGVKHNFEAEQQARSQYVKRRIAEIANGLYKLAHSANIESLKDFYGKPLKERYLPGYPDQTKVGAFIRSKLYDSMHNWAATRKTVYNQEYNTLVTNIEDAIANQDRIAWQQYLKDGLVEKGYQSPNRSYKPRKVKYEVDHMTDVAIMWNNQGRNNDDTTRAQHFLKRNNLKLITQEANRSKPKTNYTPHVGPNFTSQLADGGIKNAKKINNKSFKDAAGKNIR